jgi:hypothetical protein
MTHRSTLRPLVSLVLAVLVGAPAAASAAAATVPGHVIVRYKEGTQASERQTLRNQISGTKRSDLAIINGECIKVDGLSVDDAIEIAARNPHVLYAEPDYVWTADDVEHGTPRSAVVPNDPMYNQLYAMPLISAPQAWDIYTGDPTMKVGVIDTGIDYNHPDLVANMWTNPGEIAGNSIDDDMNGYVDDIHGYDFVNNDGDPFDDHFHGTHCAGTVAGVGNNGVGVVGVSWGLKLVGIKFLNSGGSGSTENAIASVQYAVATNLRLTSNSWGGGPFSQALLDAINAAGAAGQLFVAAAGNGNTNTDTNPHYPSSYNSQYIISVGNSTAADIRWQTSNFGLTTVDLFAPGHNILSCAPGNQYQLLTGTSMATPHVAGACALVWGLYPGMTWQQVKSRIMDFADPVPALNGLCVTGARLNVFMALADPDSTAPAAIVDLSTFDATSTTMGVQWTSTGDDGLVGRAVRTELRRSTALITEGNFAAATLVPSPTPLPQGNVQSVVVTGLAYSTLYHFAIKAFDEFGNAGPISNDATGTTLGAPAIATSSINQVTLATGGQAQQTLTISNTGEGTLDFTIPNPDILFRHAVGDHKAGGPTPPAPPVIDGRGGPDGFGNRWSDSDEPIGGPTFDWVDITGVGTPIPFTLDNQNLGPFPIGFSFPFYGTNFTTVRVCTNGWLSFTSTSTLAGNQPLPAGGTNPNNLVAPFWDDLDFRVTGDCYYYNDGSRFIVSWVNAPHLTSGGPYTFQVILYPSGEIRYQYLDMVSRLNECTIGIQNATRTIGLQVAHNANYVHNNLAVRIRPLAQWLTVAPNSGRVTPGNPVDVTLSYDATGLQGGFYDAVVEILTNAPTNAEVPAQLHVIGAPNITAPASSDFGLVFIGYPAQRVVQVSNNGTDMLNVTDVQSGDPNVTPAPTAFNLLPGTSQNVTLTYAPAAPGTLNSAVTIQSNDPDDPSRQIAITGSANVEPDIATSASSVAVSMPPEALAHRSIRVSNETVVTGADLAITVTDQMTGNVIGGNGIAKQAADGQPGDPSTSASGGPDAFGYRFRDSDEPFGPVFSWVDISAVGTRIMFNDNDQNLAPVAIGFSFPFYGTNFTTVRVCTNGWLSFTSAATVSDNQPLPAVGANPENMLAVFWDDLDFRPFISPNSRAYFHNDGTRFIVSFHDVPHAPNAGFSGTATFQVILHPDGKIVYQYLTAVSPANSATIGIQNGTRTIALQVAHNTAYVHPGLAVRIQRTPDWLTVTPGASTIPGQGFVDLDLAIASAELDLGVYTANIRIASNDPDEAIVDIPVTLTVTNTTDIDVSEAPSRFALSLAGANPTRGGARFMLAIPEPQTVNLQVYNVRGAVVRSLQHEILQPGYHPIGWDGRDASGQRAASGVYFVRMRAGSFSQTVRVTLMR